MGHTEALKSKRVRTKDKRSMLELKKPPLAAVPLAGGEWHTTRRRRVAQGRNPLKF